MIRYLAITIIATGALTACSSPGPDCMFAKPKASSSPTATTPVGTAPPGATGTGGGVTVPTGTLSGSGGSSGGDHAAPPPPEVRELAGPWVTPESCARATINGQKGWIVSDTGCGYDQPCYQDGSNKTMGKIVFVADDGTKTTLASGLNVPNGVDADGEGGVWNASKSGITYIAPDGRVFTEQVKGAGLLNDIAISPFFERTAWISDSKTGEILLAYFNGNAIIFSTYATLGDAPNGLTQSVSSNGVVVASLGDLKTPGKPGQVHAIAPASSAYGECGDWHGGALKDLGGPVPRKLDGIVPFEHNGTWGYLVSSIYDVTAAKSDMSLWWVGPDGSTEKLFDASPYGMKTAADIGRDPVTGDICIPDLGGSKGLTESGQAGAKVLIVSGLH